VIVSCYPLVIFLLWYFSHTVIMYKKAYLLMVQG